MYIYIYIYAYIGQKKRISALLLDLLLLKSRTGY